MLTSDVTAIENKENNSLKLDIYLISGKDGSYLKHGKEGLVLIRLFNADVKEIIVPLIYPYGKGRYTTLKPSYLSRDVNYYAGFEFAKFRYYFLDAKGKIVKEGIVFCSIKSVHVKSKDYSLLSILINTPQNAGVYDFKLIFDNRNLIKPIYSHNVSNRDAEKNLFYKELFVKSLSVR